MHQFRNLCECEPRVHLHTKRRQNPPIRGSVIIDDSTHFPCPFFGCEFVGLTVSSRSFVNQITSNLVRA